MVPVQYTRQLNSVNVAAPVQTLQEEVDQHKLTIQQLQEQLQAVIALKQQTSTAADEASPAAAAPQKPEASADTASATDAANAAAADDGTKADGIEEGKGKIVAINGGEQVRACCTTSSHAL